jgi:primosomal protein N' (replication factor Y)
VEKVKKKLKHLLKDKLEKNLNAKILGPVIAPIFKINKNFRFRILIRAKKTQKIQKHLSNILSNFKNDKEIKLAVDVDPISFN